MFFSFSVAVVTPPLVDRGAVPRISRRTRTGLPAGWVYAKKVTMPVGAGPDWAETVAFSFTCCPYVAAHPLPTLAPDPVTAISVGINDLLLGSISSPMPLQLRLQPSAAPPGQVSVH